jgi:hypothetical protein
MPIKKWRFLLVVIEREGALSDLRREDASFYPREGWTGLRHEGWWPAMGTTDGVMANGEAMK